VSRQPVDKPKGRSGSEPKDLRSFGLKIEYCKLKILRRSAESRASARFNGFNLQFAIYNIQFAIGFHS